MNQHDLWASNTGSLIAKPVRMLGIDICATQMAEVLLAIDASVRRGERRYISTLALHGVIESQESPELMEAINSADLTIADGMPMVLAAWLAGHWSARRVCGPDLLEACIHQRKPFTHRHYFYGGDPGVAEQLVNAAQRQNSDFLSAGQFCPPFASIDDLCTDEVADRINAANPDIVWIGLGVPKQDVWMHRMRPRLNAPVLIGVGAAFKFSSGAVARAPRWIQHIGFEWVHRTLQEPGHLWKRYLSASVKFVLYISKERLRAAGR